MGTCAGFGQCVSMTKTILSAKLHLRNAYRLLATKDTCMGGYTVHRQLNLLQSGVVARCSPQVDRSDSCSPTSEWSGVHRRQGDRLGSLVQNLRGSGLLDEAHEIYIDKLSRTDGSPRNNSLISSQAVCCPLLTSSHLITVHAL